MKKINLAALLFTGVLSTSVMAASEPGFYLGGSFGTASIDAEYFEDPSVAGLTIGYDFGNNWSMEFQTLSGEADLDFSSSTLSGEHTLDTTALYGVWRSEGDLYFKGKVGFLKETIDTTVSSGSLSSSSSTDDSGLSYGIGAGYRITDNVIVEAEYTIIEADVSALTLGLAYKF